MVLHPGIALVTWKPIYLSGGGYADWIKRTKSKRGQKYFIKENYEKITGFGYTEPSLGKFNREIVKLYYINIR